MTEVNDVRALFKHWRKLGWADNGRAPVYETIADLIADLDRTRAELARVTTERDVAIKAIDLGIERDLARTEDTGRLVAAKDAVMPRDALARDVGRAVLDALGYGAPGSVQADARMLERFVESLDDETFRARLVGDRKVAAAERHRGEDQGIIVAEVERRQRAERELAAARAAMPTAEESAQLLWALTYLRTKAPISGETMTEETVAFDVARRLTAYHAAHPTTPSEPRSNRTEATMRELSGATMDRIEFALVDQEAVLDDIGNNQERADTARALAEFRAWRASRKAPQPVAMTVAELFGSAPDLPEPCAVCSEALCECGSCDGLKVVRVFGTDESWMEPCLDCNGTVRAGGWKVRP